MAKKRGRPAGSGAATRAAESFGAMLTTVAARVDGWLSQRDQIAQDLNGIINRAQSMLSQLGNVPAAPRRRGRPVTIAVAPVVRPARKGGRRKGFKMSKEARAKIAAAQRARWANVKKG